MLCKKYNDADKKDDVPFLHLHMKKMDKQWSRMSRGRIIEKVTALFSFKI